MPTSKLKNIRLYCKFGDIVREREGRSLSLLECREEFGCDYTGKYGKTDCNKCLMLKVYINGEYIPLN